MPIHTYSLANIELFSIRTKIKNAGDYVVLLWDFFVYAEVSKMMKESVAFS